MAEYQQVSDGRPDGLQVGKADDLIALFGGTPVAQPSTIDAVLSTVVNTPVLSTAVNDSVLSTVISTAATSDSPYGYTSEQADAITDVIESLRTKVDSLGLVVTDMRTKVDNIGLVATDDRTTVDAVTTALRNLNIVAQS
ncbi:MAG: hypothetical protein PHN44_01350 [Candidatus Marinimicrobia bacterium]|nr:hypothetical protein [Candidatus Neomarinimicrobiota bacterium]